MSQPARKSQPCPACGVVVSPAVRHECAPARRPQLVREDPREYRLELPEPPSLNAMIDLAGVPTRVKGRLWPKHKYNEGKKAYELASRVAARKQGCFPPRTPWTRWHVVSVDFRLHNERDVIELLAGLKWPVDWLVKDGYVSNDSPRELPAPPTPTQRIDRGNRGVTLVIARLD